tara:strand:+ start:60 stop:554 length:495 start_codon:yes stop_codon:yes gene_type:complete
MDLKELSVEELARKISPGSDVHNELRRRNVLRTKNTTGELGEYFVVDFYNNTSGLPNLTLPPPGVQNVDVLSRNGERYSIKTTTSRTGTTGSFWNPESIERNEKIFEYLLIVILDDYYSLDLILELNWNQFYEFKRFNSRMNNYNISITRKLIESVKIVYKKSE